MTYAHRAQHKRCRRFKGADLRISRFSCHRILVGRSNPAQSDALRVCGDAAHPARQKSRPALAGPLKSPALSNPPTTGAVVSQFSAAGCRNVIRHRATGTGTRSTAPNMVGTTGKGGWVSEAKTKRAA